KTSSSIGRRPWPLRAWPRATRALACIGAPPFPASLATGARGMVLLRVVAGTGRFYRGTRRAVRTGRRRPVTIRRLEPRHPQSHALPASRTARRRAVHSTATGVVGDRAARRRRNRHLHPALPQGSDPGTRRHAVARPR